jgi:tRNA pseudouridine38-40 synthase
MVRAVVGTLLEIGTGKRPVTDIPTLLASKSRSNAGPSVPAKGLYLTQINYPENIYV